MFLYDYLMQRTNTVNNNNLNSIDVICHGNVIIFSRECIVLPYIIVLLRSRSNSGWAKVGVVQTMSFSRGLLHL